MIIPGVTKLFSPDPGLINAVVIAHSWFVKLATDEAEAILDGGPLVERTAGKLKRLCRFAGERRGECSTFVSEP